MICPQCHEENEDNASECAQCGAPLTVEDVQGASPSSVISESLKEVRSMAAVPEVLAAEKLWGVGTEERGADDGATARKEKLAEAVPEPVVPSKANLASQVPVPEPPAKADLSDKIPVVSDQPAVSEAAQLKNSSPVPSVYSEEPAASVAKEAAELFEGGDYDELNAPVLDFSGLETIVDSSYVPPVPARTGDTMEIPVIEDDDIAPRARQFVGGDDPKLAKQRSKEQKKIDKALAKEKKKAARAAKKAGIVAGAAVAGGAAAGEAAHTAEAASSAVSGPVAHAAAAGDSKNMPPSADSAEKPCAKEAPAVKTAQKPAAAKAATPVQPVGSKPSGNSGSRKSSKVKVAVVCVLLAIVALLAAAAITYHYELWGGKTIPSVTGQPVAEAQQALEAAGFTVAVQQEKSDEPEGIVLSQSPDGSRAEEGSMVTLVVSISRVIPEVVGTNVDDALKALAAEGYGNVTQTEQKSNEAAGTVLAVSPEQGSKAPTKQDITLTVAVPFTVPDVAGMDGEQAKDALSADYEVDVQYTYTEDIEPGFAVKTDPEAGSQLNSGQTVTLYLAKSRAAECMAYAQSYFNSTDRFTIGGKNYRIDPAKLTIDYIGDDTIRYTVSAIEYGSIFGIVVENNAAGWQNLTGIIRWDMEGNNIASDPEIKRA